MNFTRYVVAGFALIRLQMTGTGQHAEDESQMKGQPLRNPLLNHCHELHWHVHSDLITCGPQSSISHLNKHGTTYVLPGM